MSTPTDGTAHTADVVLFARNPESVLCVLLIQRSTDSDAFPGCWALPGGYLDTGENPEHAARRNLRKKTHLIAPADLTLVNHYDTPGRDPRGTVATTAYTAELNRMHTPHAAADAHAAQWIPVPLATKQGLAFDHAVIITDALAALRWFTEGT